MHHPWQMELGKKTTAYPDFNIKWVVDVFELVKWINEPQAWGSISSVSLLLVPASFLLIVRSDIM